MGEIELRNGKRYKMENGGVNELPVGRPAGSVSETLSSSEASRDDPVNLFHVI